MDEDFKGFLSTRGITEEEYRGASIKEKSDLVKIYEEKCNNAGIVIILNFV
jgi:hypothetical protein